MPTINIAAPQKDGLLTSVTAPTNFYRSDKWGIRASRYFSQPYHPYRVTFWGITIPAGQQIDSATLTVRHVECNTFGGTDTGFNVRAEDYKTNYMSWPVRQTTGTAGLTIPFSQRAMIGETNVALPASAVNIFPGKTSTTMGAAFGYTTNTSIIYTSIFNAGVFGIDIKSTVEALYNKYTPYSNEAMAFYVTGRDNLATSLWIACTNHSVADTSLTIVYSALPQLVPKTTYVYV